jgi:hypothetical protein
VSLNEAFKFASDETLARTERTRGRPQHASFDFNLAGTGELTITDVSRTTSGPRAGPRGVGARVGAAGERHAVAELQKLPGRAVRARPRAGDYVGGDGRPRDDLRGARGAQEWAARRRRPAELPHRQAHRGGAAGQRPPCGAERRHHHPQASQLRAQVHATAIPYNPASSNPSVDGFASA